MVANTLHALASPSLVSLCTHRGAEEYFHGRHPFHNNHTERDTVNDYGEPVPNQKGWLARFVSQKHLSDQGTGPSPDQAHQMQRRLGDSPACVLRGRFVPRVAAIRDNAGTIIESQPTQLEPPYRRQCA